MTESEKTTEFERSVLFDSPEELDKTCKRLEIIDQSGRGLGLACHFRGLEWVKVLVNNSAAFKNGDKWLYHELCYKNPNGILYYDMQEDFSFSLLDPRFLLMGMSQTWKGKDGIAEDNIIAFDKRIDAVSEEERLKCVRYFIKLNDNRICDLQKLLYLAIIHCDYKAMELLREKGVTIPQSALDLLTNEGKANQNPFYFYRFNLSFMTAEELIWIVTELSKDMESGKFIALNANFLKSIIYQFPNDPRVFDCILSHFDTKKINKKRTMQEIVLTGKPDLLEICEKYGWLKIPRKRDEMIRFAADNDKTECTAWLLEFKERTADLKAEQEKAEKKLMREINADPYSVTELKKFWGFEKREDGGIIITRYKGKRTEINVPEKIGKDIVKEIGERAFSPKAARLTSEQKNFRKAITKITLPETIEAIGNSSFYGCEKLTSVNFPCGVKSIGIDAFCGCQSLTEFSLPLSVKKIGSGAFTSCKSLVSADLPEGITEIAYRVFSNCYSLKRVTIPSTVSAIRKWAFLHCLTLEEIIIPNSVKEIGQLAFMRCLSLEEITIPEGVEKIGEKALSGCQKLRSVTLPKSVRSIETQELETIFSGCEKLTVTVPAESYAEEYCKTNNIPYIIKNTEDQK